MPLPLVATTTSLTAMMKPVDFYNDATDASLQSSRFETYHLLERLKMLSPESL
jgi:hypothetical protein